jgi:hypothetical protein
MVETHLLFDIHEKQKVWHDRAEKKAHRKLPRTHYFLQIMNLIDTLANSPYQFCDIII